MTTALHLVLLLIAPPLLTGLAAKSKAWLAGRVGAPVLQPYYDLWRLLHKGAVYSITTTWVFRAGPIVALASTLSAGLLVPLAGGRAPLSFPGDVVLFAYLAGLGHFFMMAAALDTGSSFEGMGASRAAMVSAFAEPALFLALAIVCVPARTARLDEALGTLPWSTWGFSHPAYLAAAVALFAVLLAEGGRMPVDDPDTHLELTMIHEVMVLDHGGPDLAIAMYAGALRLFVLGAVLVHLLLPIPPGGGWPGLALFGVGQAALAIVIGIVESVTARLRLLRLPQFLIGASALAALGMTVVFYRGSP